MKGINVLLALGFCAPAFAQSGVLMGGGAGNDKASFTWETRLEPPSPPFAQGLHGGVVSGQTGIHRYMQDDSRHIYLGYDIVFDPLPETNTYRVAIQPLSLAPGKLFQNSSAWTQLPLPAYPTIQTVHGGDTIALNLLVNGTTGQKVVDYILVQNKNRPVYTARGTARDFSVEDAELRIISPRITRNGNMVQSSEAGMTGAYVNFYLPDLGRYSFSLVPHPELGFQKAGEIRGSTMTLILGEDIFKVECSGRIAPGYAAYNLYVLHEPSWAPKEGREQFQMGSSDMAPRTLRR